MRRYLGTVLLSVLVGLAACEGAEQPAVPEAKSPVPAQPVAQPPATLPAQAQTPPPASDPAGAPPPASPVPGAPAATPASPAPAGASAPLVLPPIDVTFGNADPAKGEPLYQTFCSTCHGPRGGGDGPVAPGLNPPPAKHNDGNYMNALSNHHLFIAIRDGGIPIGKSPTMAPWGGTLSEPQILDVMAFIRTLPNPPYEGPMP